MYAELSNFIKAICHPGRKWSWVLEVQGQSLCYHHLCGVNDLPLLLYIYNIYISLYIIYIYINNSPQFISIYIYDINELRAIVYFSDTS